MLYIVANGLTGDLTSFREMTGVGKPAAEALYCTLEIIHHVCSTMHTSKDIDVFFSAG